ncbi:MAG: alpha-mannosidase [Candidatus Njordarchaeales archaeon]
MRVFIIPHTHWDREWYLTFNEYRLYLVRVLDKVIEGLERGDIDYFLLDGQVSALLDYLELRPWMRGRVERLVKEKKLSIGPWFTQPDEFLVSGESLIRNLLLGIRIAEEFGGVFRIGYLPDAFGHTPQLPQILRGFGIDTFLFSRGMDDEVPCQFIWEAPDGSRVFSYFMRDGYCNGHFLGIEEPYRRFMRVFTNPYSRKTIYYTYYFEEPEPDLGKIIEGITQIIKRERECGRGDYYLIMNGCDHLPAQIKLMKYLKKIKETLKIDIIVGGLEEFFDHIKAIPDLPVYRGELRKCKYRPILADVLSTRIYLKQLNFKAQKLLEKYLEPVSVIVSQLGYEYPQPLIRTLWIKLLLNHAHDSICGTSVDEVHRENVARFQEVIAAASNMMLQELYYLGNLTNKEGPKILVFNPNNWNVTGPVKVIVPGFVDVDAVVDPDSSVVPVNTRELPEGEFKEVTFIARDIPPMGYKVYGITRDKPSINNGLRIQESRVETRFFEVFIDMEHGASLVIKDKRNGRVYSGLNIIVDEGDVGDVYNYDRPDEGEDVSSLDAKASIELIEKNPEYAIIKAEYVMMIPEKAINRERSSEKVPVKVEVYYTFYKDIPRIDTRIVITNTARDHRMRALFPIDTRSDKALSEVHFYDYYRKIEEPEESDWIEQSPKVHPMQDYVAVFDDEGGILIATRGLHEYSVKKNGNKVLLYITLLRSVGSLSKDNLRSRKGHAGPPLPVPEAQCIGKIEVEYSIIPIIDLDEGVKEAKNFTQPLVGVFAEKKGSLPPKNSFFEISPNTVYVSALKMSEDGNYVILRLFNRSNTTKEAVIKSYFPIEEAWITNLKEERIRRITSSEDSIRLEIKPWRIETIALRLRSRANNS